VRLAQNGATTAFFIWVITGGLDAYAGTYDAIGRHIGLEIGSADALVLTAIGLVAWAAFASTVQVLVYRRGLASWDQLAAHPTDIDPNMSGQRKPRDEFEPRFDPRAVTLAALVAFALLLSGTEWVLLAAVSAWLALAWAAARPDKEPLKTGLAFAALLAGGAFLFGLGAGLGLDVALRRMVRAGLLVLVATWLRGAAGAEGLREVSRRALGRLHRLPGAPEAALVLDQIAAEGRLAAAGRTLLDKLSGVRARPLPLLDAVLGWVVHESKAFKAAAPRRAATALAVGPLDLVLVLLAAAPALGVALA
jgi:hypothetical protein